MLELSTTGRNHETDALKVKDENGEVDAKRRLSVCSVEDAL